MKIGEAQFRALVAELVDENPFACRALLQILGIEFTPAVPTLAVTCGKAPRLLVNLDFLRQHCAHETHVKAVICHEFLHVLLRHTERTSPLTPSEHLALDAVINAIIHRELGKDYSDFMRLFYANVTGAYRLLRPFDRDEGMRARGPDALFFAWQGLYDGHAAGRRHPRPRQGPHDARARRAEGWLARRPRAARTHTRRRTRRRAHVGTCDRGAGTRAGVDERRRHLALAEGPRHRGHAPTPTRSAPRKRAWSAGAAQTWEVLRRHLLPDPRAPKTEDELAECRLPVLSPGDRRSFARALWSPLIPEAAWESHRAHRRRQRAGVPRRERLDECRDAADRGAAGAPGPAHPPAVLGLQRRGRARGDPRQPPARRHHGRHQHELRAARTWRRPGRARRSS